MSIIPQRAKTITISTNRFYHLYQTNSGKKLEVAKKTLGKPLKRLSLKSQSLVLNYSVVLGD